MFWCNCVVSVFLSVCHPSTGMNCYGCDDGGGDFFIFVNELLRIARFSSCESLIMGLLHWKEWS